MINFIDCGKNEFKNRVNGKRIYCFGAGRYLKDFIDENYGIQVEGVIDNYSYMEKKTVIIDNIVVEIVSLEKFMQVFDDKCVVLITTLSFDEVIKQLDSIELFNGMDCYIEFFIRHYTEYTDIKIVNKSEKELIPRKIHYCWFGGKEIPQEYKKNIESWKNHCPNYEIIRWDEINYNIHKNSYISQAYNNKKWAFVADYARVDILYEQGGIYLDTDVELLKPLDEFLIWKMFCGFESSRLVSWGIGFGASKKEKILKDVLDVYDNMNFVNSDGSFNMTTCPIIQSNVLKQHGFQLNGQFQVKDGVAIYPKEFFAPLDYLRGFGQITSHTHSIHHYAATWTDNEQKIHRSNLEQKIAEIRKRTYHCDDNEKVCNTNRFQIWECLSESNVAGGKAPKDVKNILAKFGYHVIDIHPYEKGIESNSKDWRYKRLIEEWGNCYNIVSNNAILLLQYPFCQGQEEQNRILTRLKQEKNIRIVTFVHDVENLRGIFFNEYRKTEFNFMLQLSDIIIVHNDAMKSYFMELGIHEERLIKLEIFDYLCDKKEHETKFERSITIAGNLQQIKSPYIGKLHNLAPLKINLYGPNYVDNSIKEKENSSITYCGSFSSDKIINKLDRGFGLVWDGDSLSTCSGATGEYLRYNNPHKLSLYLAAGLPIIIWSEAAEAPFVEKYGLGFTINSLYEIQKILETIDEECYMKYLESVKKISRKLIQGDYTKLAIKKVEDILLRNVN